MGQADETRAGAHFSTLYRRIVVPFLAGGPASLRAIPGVPNAPSRRLPEALGPFASATYRHMRAIGAKAIVPDIGARVLGHLAAHVPV